MSVLQEHDIDILRCCKICPRRCGTNRFDRAGVCGADASLYVSSVNLHFGEEPPISGFSGSGTIFLTYCNMRCVYCQNYPISQQGAGRKYTIDELVNAMLSLQKRGAHNINWVTPSHYVVQLHRAAKIARENGLKIPIVYNTSGYDTVEAIELVNDTVDIYMPDFRYWNSEFSSKYSGADDYPEIAKLAIKKMHSYAGDLVMDENGIAKKGILIRLLVLPGNVSGTMLTLNWIAENLGTNTYISVMSQYFPAHRAYEFPPLNRKISSEEYIRVLEHIDKLGFSRGYIQPSP